MQIKLPEAAAADIHTQSIINKTVSAEQQEKNIVKTISAWVLIFLGGLIIAIGIIGNKKVPKEYDPKAKTKNNLKFKRKKTKNYFI